MFENERVRGDWPLARVFCYVASAYVDASIIIRWCWCGVCCLRARLGVDHRLHMLACVHASRQDLLFRIRLIWLSAHAAQDNDAKPLMIDGTRVTRQRRKTPNDRWWWRSVLDPITSNARWCVGVGQELEGSHAIASGIPCVYYERTPTTRS
jgi:hypothetical protein